jgi:hypothetical protein
MGRDPEGENHAVKNDISIDRKKEEPYLKEAPHDPKRPWEGQRKYRHKRALKLAVDERKVTQEAQRDESPTKEKVSRHREDGGTYLERTQRKISECGEPYRGCRQYREWNTHRVQEPDGGKDDQRETYLNKSSEPQRKREDSGKEPREHAESPRGLGKSEPSGHAGGSKKENAKTSEQIGDLDPPSDQKGKAPEGHSEDKEEHVSPEDMYVWVAF